MMRNVDSVNVIAIVLALRVTALSDKGPQSPSQLLGTWHVALHADARGRTYQRPVAAKASGTITFSQFLGTDSVRAHADIDFKPLGGPPCFWRSDATLPIRVAGDSIEIDFTPGAADCGLYVWARIHGDTVSGTWAEPSIRIGAGTRGTIQMTRARR